MSNVIVFDLDGVITSERAYWDAAGLVIHELLYSPRYWNITGTTSYIPVTSAEESRRISRATFPQEVIIGLKARSVNSNWDTCYVGMCVCLIALLAELRDCSMLLPLQPWDEEWTALFRRQLAVQRGYKALDPAVFQRLNGDIFRGVIGLDLINRFDAYASAELGQPVEGVFGHYSSSWKFCTDLFQAWYLGDELYTSSYDHTPAQEGKAGCIRFEQPLLPIEGLRATLEGLRARGYTLGVATGRPGQEAILPLKNYGLYDYFDEQRIVTHTEVARAEAMLRARGDETSLVKPHPYQFVRAADPAYLPGMPLPARGSFIVVGDTPGDVLGAHAANALMIAVLTGAITPEARSSLERSQPDFLIEDVTLMVALLEQIEDLGTIQRMQFQEKARAELLLQRWFMRHMNLSVERVTLVPKPVSLNSFNGFYAVDGEEYFFKTHVEEQGILQEYYHAELLSKARYNVVQPLRTLHERDRQMVVYPVVHWPVMFDLMRAIETGQAEQAQADTLIAAEKRECERLLSIYEETLASSAAWEHAHAPVHQLFWHRLIGGRYRQFYVGKQVPLPGQGDNQEVSTVAFNELLRYRWVVNGTPVDKYYSTLGELIERAKVVLHPERAGATVIGHGDAHFGNVFLEEQHRYLYFDPAFAGRHSPLLDIVKPFFHNVFASWMYFAFDIAQQLALSVALYDKTVYIEHDFTPAAIRQAVLDTKIESLLKPLIALQRSRGVLPADWADIVRMALMCCPLLTMNLLDSERIPTTIGWLGLSQVMQMGNFPLFGEDVHDRSY